MADEQPEDFRDEARHQARLSAIQDIADDVRVMRSDVDDVRERINESYITNEETRAEASARVAFVRWELIRRNKLFLGLVIILITMNAWQWRLQTDRDNKAEQDRHQMLIVIEHVESCLTPGEPCFQELKAQITGKVK